MSLHNEIKPDFQRYLTAKTSVDDRALNRVVWSELVARLPAEPKVLEIACGVGTMYTRMLEWGLMLEEGKYLGTDIAPGNISAAQAGGLQGDPKFKCADFFDLEPDQSYDLLVAAAFLDLMPLERALPHLLQFLKPGGLAYFPINFDGVTLFEPAHKFDAAVLGAYHHSMDSRESGGHSLTGRQLFQAFPSAGFDILSAGASDWIVYPSNGTYPADEAYFLDHILHFFETSCAHVDGMDEWLAVRRGQVANGTLTFIAHQYDFLVQRT
jgi:SAM-dependent methyltransferase